MKLIDVGVNLMNSSFDRDREELIKNAAAAGVSPLIVSGSSVKNSQDAALYVSSYNAAKSDSLFSTAGLHPHDAKSFDETSIVYLRELCTGENADFVKAIGECGLDYNRDFSPRDIQRRCFVKQAELAAELFLPLFLHERDAFADFSVIISEHFKYVPAALVHCFTGSGDELEYYLSLGCYIGITGWICDERRGKHLRELVKLIPSDRLLLETDAPYLLPRDLGGKVKDKRNEPKYLPHIAETVASCQGKDPMELANETYNNSKRFFGLL